VSPSDIAALLDDEWRIEANETRPRDVTAGAGSRHTSTQMTQSATTPGSVPAIRTGASLRTGTGHADTLFVGGTIRSGVTGESAQDALAVTSGQIAGVGTAGRRVIGPSTVVIDLDGGALLPAWGDGMRTRC